MGKKRKQTTTKPRNSAHKISNPPTNSSPLKDESSVQLSDSAIEELCKSHSETLAKGDNDDDDDYPEWLPLKLPPIEPVAPEFDWMQYMIVFNVSCLYLTMIKLIFVLADASWRMDSYPRSEMLEANWEDLNGWLSILVVAYGLALFVLVKYRHTF